MKKIVALLMVVLFVALGFAACGGGERDEALVGSWQWDVLSTYQYTFNADGTGERNADGDPAWSSTFSWSTSGDTLRINPRGSRNESWTYSVDGDVLHLSGYAEYSYNRIG